MTPVGARRPMKYLVALIVLVISAGSVMLGVEWTSAPMTPMAASSFPLRAAAPPVAQQAAKPPVKTPEPAKETVKAAEGAMPAPAAAAPPTPVVAASPPAPEPAPLVAPEVAATPPAPLCDVAACERAFRTFTASDCTYQPSGDGPRRLCTRGSPPAAATSPRADIRAQATCNIAACSNAYISFNAADCTYQPSDGPRRICER